MSDRPDVDELGAQFVRHYYTIFDGTKDNEQRAEMVAGLYHDDARLTFQNAIYLGKAKIIEKIKCLGFKTIQRSVSSVDCQLSVSNGIVILVGGQMKADDDKVMGYSHFFHLFKFEPSVYLITNEIFRLELHDFATQE